MNREESRKAEAGSAARLELETDEALARHIGEGNAGAFQVLMARYVNMHLAFAERIMGNRQEAEDIVQDAFAKLWVNAGKYDPSKAKFTTWFYRIVLNRCLDKKRKKRPVALPENYDVRDDAPTPAEALAEREKQQRVKDALEQIPDRQQAAIMLCYFEGLSNREAADILGLKVKALESLLCRGRKNLGNLLKG